MTSVKRALTMVALSVLLLGSTCRNQIPPAAPKIISATLVGQQLCGPFTTSATTLAVVCGLPTSGPAGWLLVPNPRPGSDGPVDNVTMTVRVTTNSLNRLVITDTTTNTARPVIQITNATPVPANTGAVPQYLGQFGEAKVDVSGDDGTVRNWTITVRLNPCKEMARLTFVAVDGAGATSPPATMILLHDSQQLSSTSGSCPPPASRISLTSASPDHGAPGKQITLNGSNFSSGTATVHFGGSGHDASGAVISSSAITVTVPNMTSAHVNLSVTDPQWGSPGAIGFHVTGVPPEILSIRPPNQMCRQIVTLAGHNFGGSMDVQVKRLDNSLIASVRPFNVTDSRADFVVPSMNAQDVNITIGYSDETPSGPVRYHVTQSPMPCP